MNTATNYDQRLTLLTDLYIRLEDYIILEQLDTTDPLHALLDQIGLHLDQMIPALE